MLEWQKEHWDFGRRWFEPFAMERISWRLRKARAASSDRDSTQTADRMGRYDFAASCAMAKIDSNLWSFFTEREKVIHKNEDDVATCGS